MLRKRHLLHVWARNAGVIEQARVPPPALLICAQCTLTVCRHKTRNARDAAIFRSVPYVLNESTFSIQSDDGVNRTSLSAEARYTYRYYPYVSSARKLALRYARLMQTDDSSISHQFVFSYGYLSILFTR